MIFRMNHNIKDDYSEEEDTDDNEDTADELSGITMLKILKVVYLNICTFYVN